MSINELLPWLELPEPYGPITLHHLLTHTSGLMGGTIEGSWGAIDAIHARAFPPAWPPGQRFWYSNLGYTLVGLALERTTGTPVHRLLLERILGPLGMTRSAGAITEEDRSDAAVGYEPIDADRVPHEQSALGPAAWQPSNTADGSIISTAPDLCAYARVVLAGGAGLLEPEAFDRWTAPHADSDDRGVRYGYGWDVLEEDGHQVLRHTGGTVGFTTILEIWPDEGLAVAICENGSGEKRPLAGFALSSVAAVLRGSDPPDEPTWHAPLAADLAGSYVAGSRTLSIEAGDGAGTVRAGPLAAGLRRLGAEPDELVVVHPALDRYPLRVMREPDGTIAGLAHGPTWFVREGASAPAPTTAPAAGEAIVGLYRTDSPWYRAFRVYLRNGRPYLLHPTAGDERELLARADGTFGVGDLSTPVWVRFLDPIEGVPQTLEYNGAKLTRSFET